jgi:hypothetical protein
VEEILALEVQPLLRSEPVGAGQRRRAPRVVARKLVELGGVALVRECVLPGGRQLVERGDQGLGHVAAAVGAVGRHAFAAST